MAKKINATRLAQETRGRAAVMDRWPAAVSPALYLMQVQLRLPRLKISPSKIKLSVKMDAAEADAVPRPVKITHVA